MARTNDGGDQPQYQGVWMNPWDMVACFRRELVTINIAFGRLVQVMVDERNRTGSWPYDEDLCQHLITLAQVTGTAIIGCALDGADQEHFDQITERIRAWREEQDARGLQELIRSTIKLEL